MKEVYVGSFFLVSFNNGGAIFLISFFGLPAAAVQSGRASSVACRGGGWGGG